MTRAFCRRARLLARQLQNTRAGAIIAAHLANAYVLQTHEHREAATSQVYNWRRILFEQVEKSLRADAPLPFGLGRGRMPEYIAVLNLSGERLLVHTSNRLLLWSLCSNLCNEAESIEDMLGQVAHFAEANPTHGAALFYSLPWQAGHRCAFWGGAHLTCDPSLRHPITDGHLVASSSHSVVQSGQPTTAGDRGIARIGVLNPVTAQVCPFVSPAQTRAFADTFTAVCLDAPEEAAAPSSDSTSKSETLNNNVADSALERLKTGLLHQRKELQAKLQQLRGKMQREKLAHKEEMLDLQACAEKKTCQAIESAMRQRSAALEECAQAKLALRESMEALATVKAELAREQSLHALAKEAAETETSRTRERTRILVEKSRSQAAQIAKLKSEAETDATRAKNAMKEAIADHRRQMEAADAKCKHEQEKVQEKDRLLSTLVLSAEHDIANQRAKEDAERAKLRKEIDSELKSMAQAMAAAEGEAARAVLELAEQKKKAEALVAQPCAHASSTQTESTMRDASTLTHFTVATQYEAPEPEKQSPAPKENTTRPASPPAAFSLPSSTYQFVSPDQTPQAAFHRMQFAVAGIKEWIDFLSEHNARMQHDLYFSSKLQGAQNNVSFPPSQHAPPHVPNGNAFTPANPPLSNVAVMGHPI